MKVIYEADVAGVGAWKLGLEKKSGYYRTLFRLDNLIYNQMAARTNHKAPLKKGKNKIDTSVIRFRET